MRWRYARLRDDILLRDYYKTRDDKSAMRAHPDDIRRAMDVDAVRCAQRSAMRRYDGDVMRHDAASMLLCARCLMMLCAMREMMRAMLTLMRARIL